MKNGSDFNGISFLNIEHLKYLYLSPQGRINRQRLWIGMLLVYLATIPVFVFPGILIFILFYISLGIASVMLLVKRAHDRNHSGW